MRKLFLALVASAVLALGVIASAGADRNAASFAVGGATADFFFGTQHYAFSAHNGSLAFSGGDCSAKGHLNWTISDLDFALSGDVVMLTITPGANGGGLAFVVVQITNVTPGFGFSAGDYALFDFGDSNMHPDGTGDTVFFEGSSPAPPPCYNGAPGFPITSGNIVVKAGSLVP